MSGFTAVEIHVVKRDEESWILKAGFGLFNLVLVLSFLFNSTLA